MQIGFNLPVSGPMAEPATMARTARLGEELGFDYLTLTDHIALPDTSVPGYPYSESGAFYSPEPGHRHEQLVAATFVAARTERIRLVLAVLVVPHRPAVLAAKMLTSLDVLSGGRLTVGVGAGWLEAEFDAVVTTPFAERGAVTDAYLDAFRALWTEDKPRIAGKYVRYDGLVFDPKPVQRPHPPIWVGGESGPSMRRAARVGDAWYPIGSNNAHLLDTLPRLEAGIARLRRLTEAAGRTRPPSASSTASSGTATRRRRRATGTAGCSAAPSTTSSRTCVRCAASGSPASTSTSRAGTPTSPPSRCGASAAR